MCVLVFSRCSVLNDRALGWQLAQSDVVVVHPVEVRPSEADAQQSRNADSIAPIAVSLKRPLHRFDEAPFRRMFKM